MRRVCNRLVFAAGSYLAVNGGLLLCSPSHFAAFHKMPSLPDPVNDALDNLSAHRRAGRAIGLASVLLGLACLMIAVAQASPRPSHLG